MKKNYTSVELDFEYFNDQDVMVVSGADSDILDTPEFEPDIFGGEL